MTQDTFALVMVHLTGLLVGWFVGRQGTWLVAYRKGLDDSRDIWMRSQDEAHAVLLTTIGEERAQMAATFREQIRASQNKRSDEKTADQASGNGQKG